MWLVAERSYCTALQSCLSPGKNRSLLLPIACERLTRLLQGTRHTCGFSVWPASALLQLRVTWQAPLTACAVCV